jgi:hypothetical protein
VYHVNKSIAGQKETSLAGELRCEVSDFGAFNTGVLSTYQKSDVAICFWRC